MEERLLIHAENGRDIPALLFYPGDTNFNSPDAILHIHLHGIGEMSYVPNKMDRLDALRSSGCTQLFSDAQKTYKGKNFLTIAPQLDQSDMNSFNRNGTWAEWYITDVFNYMKSKYSYGLDPQRGCLSGLSLGGGGALNYITSSLANASKFSAVVACCPVGIWSGFENITGAKLPVAFYHAKNDPLVSSDNSINAAQAINSQADCKLKARAKITGGSSHAIWNDCFNATGDPFGNGVNVFDFFIQSKYLNKFEMPEVDKIYVPPSPLPVVEPIDPARPVAVISVAKDQVPPLGYLIGSASKGEKLTYKWSKISGPKGSTISFPTRSETYVKGLVPGTHVFQLTVTDAKGRTAVTEVTILIKGEPDQDGWLVKPHYTDGTAGAEQLVGKEKVSL